MDEFTEKEWMLLKNNPAVKCVEGNSIFYTDKFKKEFIRLFEQGERPVDIFKEAGFDVDLIGKKRIERAAQRWKENRKLTGHGRGEFTEKEIEILKNKDAVLTANSKRIIYSEKFKEFFIENYKKGYTPTEIFRMAKFDIRMIGTKRIERAAARWKRKYIEDGSLCKSK